MLSSLSSHAALGHVPASLPQLHVLPISELVLRVMMQSKRVQCILQSMCVPFIILSPQARPMLTPLFPCFCPLLGYLCVCLVLPPASGVLEDQGDSWLLASGLPPLPHMSRCPRLCCLMAETGPSSRAVSPTAIHQLLQRSHVVSSFSAGLCSWLKPRQAPVGGVIDPLELHLMHKVLI